jgi:polar amino acid transport system permease protein
MPADDPQSVLDLTSEAGRRAFAAQLIFNEQRQLRHKRIKLAIVWGVLFGGLILASLLLNIDFAYIFENAGFVLEGIWVTLGVSFVSITAATVLALLGAIGRLSRNSIWQGISGFYVSLFRGTPLLVQIFIIYLGLPQIGQQLTLMGYPRLGQLFILTALQSGILALSLNYGAYMTEIFRAGIQSVSNGQWQAAAALGMSYWPTFYFVILPQAFRTIIPAIGNQFIAMQKDSALVSVMGIWEITYRANRFARKDSKFMEMFLLAASVYWVLTIISEYFQGRLERRMARSERPHGR